jgi:hypothetical protein
MINPHKIASLVTTQYDYSVFAPIDLYVIMDFCNCRVYQPVSICLCFSLDIYNTDICLLSPLLLP